MRPETCGLIFVRAAMTALATVHATSYGYQQDCGGRKAFLERYPIIKDQNRLPKFSEMKVTMYLFAYNLLRNFNMADITTFGFQ